MVVAAAVERDDHGAFAQAQHAAHVIRRGVGQPHVGVRHQRRRHENARQSHVAATMPSRAVTINASIWSGVITYGGMK